MHCALCIVHYIMLGIYVHIPFCKSKCPYCDFYSMRCNDELMDRYLSALVDDIRETSADVTEAVDTVYFGGGTPSVFGGERIGKILDAIRESYKLVSPEITVECNPSTTDYVFYETLFKAGVNRISLGMQSAVDKERKNLGRAADKNQVAKSIAEARQAGINNISLDMMLGIPHQTIESLDESIDFIKEQNVEHISAYMLKIEKGTRFYDMGDKLVLPDEDEVCDMYLYFSRQMRGLGYEHYEISNFAKPSQRARHNTKYWRDEEYLGFGPSAYSFYKGVRYHYDADMEKYLTEREAVIDEAGGDREEYLMLALRLSDGLVFEQYEKRYGHSLTADFFNKVRLFEKQGLMLCDEKHAALTPEGFLLSNTIIAELINE